MWNNYQKVGIAYEKWEEEMLVDEDLPEVTKAEQEAFKEHLATKKMANIELDIDRYLFEGGNFYLGKYLLFMIVDDYYGLWIKIKTEKCEKVVKLDKAVVREKTLDLELFAKQLKIQHDLELADITMREGL